MQEYQTLWRNEAVLYDASTLNEINWFTTAGGTSGEGDLHVGSTTIPDATVAAAGNGSVWHEINMNGFDGLRIYGEIYCITTGTLTVADVGIVPFAFGRPLLQGATTGLLTGTDGILGQDLAFADANEESGGTRLTNFAIQRTAETTDILLTSTWSQTGTVSILPGALATDAQPVLLATPAIATRRWFYDVGYFGVAGSTYTEAIGPGVPIARLSAMPKVYVGIGARNDTAGTGANAILGGRILAIKYRKGLSQR